MYLSVTDSKIVGVCGGISEFFGFNSTTLRIVFVLFAIMGGITKCLNEMNIIYNITYIFNLLFRLC